MVCSEHMILWYKALISFTAQRGHLRFMPNKPTAPCCHLFSVSTYTYTLSKKQVPSSRTNPQAECILYYLPLKMLT